MNILGVGAMEFLLIVAIGVMVVGPKRLIEGLRTWRKAYTELKRQRDELVAAVEEAVELDEIKKQLASDEIEDQIGALKSELTLDQPDDDRVPVQAMSVARGQRLAAAAPGEQQGRAEESPGPSAQGGETAREPQG